MAQAAPTASSVAFLSSEADAVLAKLADTLESDFVSPEAGRAYADALRTKQKAGGYRSFADARSFAEAVTSDLQAIHKDGHLRLFAPQADAGGKPRSPMAIPEASTITAAGWLAPGVAYVNFTAFFGNDATLAELRSFLDKVKGAETLIIDARQHRGGGLEEMDMLFPQLFGGRTALVDMDTRESVFNAAGDVFAEVPSVVRVAAPASVVRQRHWATPAAAPGLKDAKVYLLTSHFTASAAEHLALALKRTGRATLVGETTRGAGNYGRRVDLGSGYSAFVPVGRTFDPDTGEGWEGTGVPPHLSVPADQALDAALKAAGLPVTGKVALANLR